MRLKHLLLLCSLSFLLSCTDKLDFENLDDFQYKGEWTVPVFNANLNLENVLINDSTFTVDSDGGLRIIFDDDSLFSQTTADLAKVPDQDPQSFSLNSDSHPLIISTELGVLAGAKLKNVTVLEGGIDWKFVNSDNYPATVELKITNATLNGDTARFVLQSNGIGENTGTFDIATLDFDFTQGSSGYNFLEYKMQILNNGGAPNGTKYDLEVQIKDVVVEDAIGYFGNRTINIPSGSINLPITGFENFLNGLYLEDPTINIIAMGNVGLPLELRPKLDGSNTINNIVSLGLTPQNYFGPSSPGDWDTSTIIINKTTSNIIDFIANVPKNIIYSGELELNPTGETGIDNFVTHDGVIKVGMHMDLPLELKAKDMILEQWIYDFDLGVEEDEVNLIEKLDLYFKVENGFPFDSDLELLFVDSLANISLDSVSVDLFNSAVVDAQGKVVESTVSRPSLKLTDANIENLIKANKLRIRVRLNSYNNGSQVVKLYNDYAINIKLGIGVKLKVDLQE